VTERRRGAELEEALLEAAWGELREKGYIGLTMESVAARANTSRPVLARRWPSKPELVIETLRHRLSKTSNEVVDQGDLRSELLDYLDKFCERAHISIPALTLFSNLQEEGLPQTPQDLRTALMTGSTGMLEKILDRAVRRGEIDSQKLNPAITTVLRDLCRHYTIMHFAAPPPELRAMWIDTIFLPLVRIGTACSSSVPQ